jgi:hypothetical protein
MIQTLTWQTAVANLELPHPWMHLSFQVLAVPSYFSPADFLKYVQALEPEIECLRMIRDLSPSRSIVLIQLRSAAAAKEFVLEFNGKPFNAFEVRGPRLSLSGLASARALA